MKVAKATAIIRTITKSHGFRFGLISGLITEAAMIRDSLCTLKGAPISTVAVNGPFIFFGSRHESEQVPPQPYSKLKLRL